MDDTDIAKYFRDHIRRFNSAFAMVSTGAKVISGGFGFFTVQGTLHHKLGSLLPVNDSTPKAFSQLYMYDDAEEEINARLNLQSMENTPMDKDITRIIYNTLVDCNPYVQTYKSAFEILKNQPNESENTVRIVLRSRGLIPEGCHPGQYNLPSRSQVAAILPGLTIPLKKFLHEI